MIFKPRKQQDGSGKSEMKMHISSETLVSSCPLYTKLYLHYSRIIQAKQEPELLPFVL